MRGVPLSPVSITVGLRTELCGTQVIRSTIAWRRSGRLREDESLPEWKRELIFACMIPREDGAGGIIGKQEEGGMVGSSDSEELEEVGENEEWWLLGLHARQQLQESDEATESSLDTLNLFTTTLRRNDGGVHRTGAGADNGDMTSAKREEDDHEPRGFGGTGEGEQRAAGDSSKLHSYTPRPVETASRAAVCSLEWIQSSSNLVRYGSSFLNPRS